MKMTIKPGRLKYEHFQLDQLCMKQTGHIHKVAYFNDKAMCVLNWLTENYDVSVLFVSVA